jgi:transcriptional regulator with XRE-family HTH domain
MKFYKENFKKFREAKGLTMEEVAKLVGVTKQAVEHWEAGRNKPKARYVQAMANAINHSVIDISDLPPERKLVEETNREYTPHFDEWDKAMIETYCKLSPDDKRRMQNYCRDINKPPEPYIIQAYKKYIYVEYIAKVNLVEYEKFLIALVSHPAYGKLPVVQRTNLNYGIDTENIMRELAKIYEKHIHDYPLKWAGVCSWDDYEKFNVTWNTHASTVTIQRKLFVDLRDAIAWATGFIDSDIAELQENIIHLTKTRRLKVQNYINHMK